MYFTTVKQQRLISSQNYNNNSTANSRTAIIAVDHIITSLQLPLLLKRATMCGKLWIYPSNKTL